MVRYRCHKCGGFYVSDRWPQPDVSHDCYKRPQPDVSHDCYKRPQPWWVVDRQFWLTGLCFWPYWLIAAFLVALCYISIVFSIGESRPCQTSPLARTFASTEWCSERWPMLPRLFVRP